ncbi:hypothetical protein Scep_010270 [Stephania cephalantha]|uniref:Uncharacterized protein n=1 Tax=Stephania cephalantha TaxID=152367 RepID=A0AAP0PF18_9MAGN
MRDGEQLLPSLGPSVDVHVQARGAGCLPRSAGARERSVDHGSGSSLRRGDFGCHPCHLPRGRGASWWGPASVGGVGHDILAALIDGASPRYHPPFWCSSHSSHF